MTRKKTRRKKHQDKKRNKLIILMAVIIVVGVFGLWRFCFSPVDINSIHVPGYVQQEIIGQDGHSRTGWALERPKNIVVHYVANPGSSAKQNRDFFNSSGSRVSAHFIVGLEGEVIQCIPLNEQSSASNNRNVDTISIEICHPDSTGQFNDKTYGAVVKLTAWLCRELRLDAQDVIRHYDITGKNCPKYFVENTEAWETFLDDVKREK